MRDAAIGVDADADAEWPETRWVEILDRIEHRQPDVGLRFWGPPLWLEVTMTGPDSDQWPIVSGEAVAWDWQSSTACVEAGRLAAEGVDDDRLLDVVGRYTIENLILNAVHEIGEWFRFDGMRVFPAHGPGVPEVSGAEEQGNGAVTLRLELGGAPDRPPVVAPDAQRGRALVGRLAGTVAPSRFTYLPGTTISFEAAGPVVRRRSGAEPAAAWHSAWSESTLAAVAADTPELVAAVAGDVHRALVLHEADRICRAFHLDGRRPWHLAVPDAVFGSNPPDTGARDTEPLTISIDGAGGGANAGGLTAVSGIGV